MPNSDYPSETEAHRLARIAWVNFLLSFAVQVSASPSLFYLMNSSPLIQPRLSTTDRNLPSLQLLPRTSVVVRFFSSSFPTGLDLQCLSSSP